MIYIFENSANTASIVFDGTTLTEEQKTKAVIIDQLPEPQPPAGKMAVLKVKKATGEVWYEYVDKPEAPVERRIADLEMAIAAILGGAM